MYLRYAICMLGILLSSVSCSGDTDTSECIEGTARCSSDSAWLIQNCVNGQWIDAECDPGEYCRYNACGSNCGPEIQLSVDELDITGGRFSGESTTCGGQHYVDANWGESFSFYIPVDPNRPYLQLRILHGDAYRSRHISTGTGFCEGSEYHNLDSYDFIAEGQVIPLEHAGAECAWTSPVSVNMVDEYGYHVGASGEVQLVVNAIEDDRTNGCDAWDKIQLNLIKVGVSSCFVPLDTPQ